MVNPFLAQTIWDFICGVSSSPTILAAYRASPAISLSTPGRAQGGGAALAGRSSETAGESSLCSSFHGCAWARRPGYGAWPYEATNVVVSSSFSEFGFTTWASSSIQQSFSPQGRDCGSLIWSSAAYSSGWHFCGMVPHPTCFSSGPTGPFCLGECFCALPHAFSCDDVTCGIGIGQRKRSGLWSAAQLTGAALSGGTAVGGAGHGAAERGRPPLIWPLAVDRGLFFPPLSADNSGGGPAGDIDAGTGPWWSGTGAPMSGHVASVMAHFFGVGEISFNPAPAAGEDGGKSLSPGFGSLDGHPAAKLLGDSPLLELDFHALLLVAHATYQCAVATNYTMSLVSLILQGLMENMVLGQQDASSFTTLSSLSASLLSHHRCGCNLVAAFSDFSGLSLRPHSVQPTSIISA